MVVYTAGYARNNGWFSTFIIEVNVDLENIGSILHIVLYISFYMLHLYCSHAVSLPTQTWSGRSVLAEGTRDMDACSGLGVFCLGEEDGWLSVKKVRFVGGRYITSLKGSEV